MPLAKIPDGELYYESHGDGDPLLLIAGFGCDHLYWSLVLPGLAAKHRVIVFDNRGTGQTTAPVASLTVQSMAADAAALLDALAISTAHIAGHSMGGMIAQELAAAHPAKMRSLTLIATTARLDERGRAIVELWGDLPSLTDPRTMCQLIAHWMYTNRFFATPGALDKLIDEMLSVKHPPTLEGIREQSLAISRADTTSRLNQIRCPTLIVAGREDIVMPAEFTRNLADDIPDAELLVIEDAGHGLLIETPAQFVDAFHYFLTRRQFLFGSYSKPTA